MQWLIELLELLGLIAPDTPDSTIPPRVVVRVRDDVSTPYQDALESRLAGADAAAWTDVLGLIPGLTLARAFTALPPPDLQALMDRAAAASGEAAPNLFAWYAVTCPADVGPDILAGVLADAPFIQLAYPEPSTTLASVNTTDPQVPNQGYLRSAPEGVDAFYAWDVPGGDGSGTRFIDVENAWDLAHEDLASAHVIQTGGTPNVTFIDHGTASLGVVMASPNGLGCIGIAPNTTGYVEAVGGNDPTKSLPIANAITRVVQQPTSTLQQLGPGDVLLLEQQVYFMPIEVDPAVSDAILVATRAGVVIIEAAGNGARDLKPLVALGSSKHIFDATLPSEFKETGAIMVGAASAGPPNPLVHMRVPASNFGDRVDCYAWGQNVQTLTSQQGPAGLVRGYTTGAPPTPHFSQTSSAASVVAGVAVATQSMAKTLGAAKTAIDVRNLFRDAGLTTAAIGPPAPPAIGGMPNLRAIAHRLGAVRPTGLTSLKFDATHLRLFAVRDADDTLGVWSGGPGGWTAAPDPHVTPLPAARPVSAVTRAGAGGPSIDVFYIDRTGALRWVRGSSTVPAPWPSQVAGAGVTLNTVGRTAAVARRADRMDVFAIGNDSGLYQTSWAGTTWSSLARIGGAQVVVPEGGLAAVAPTANTLHAVAIGDSPTALFATRWSGEPPRQHNWLPMTMISGAAPARPNGGPALVSRSLSATRSLVDVFVVGDDQRVYSSFFDTSANPLAWQGLFVIGNDIKMDALAGVAAVARTTNNLDVFAIGVDGLLYTIWWQGAPAVPWGTWLQIGGLTKLVAGGRIAAVARGPSDIEVFVVGVDGHFLTLRWTGSWPAAFTPL